LLLLLPLLLLQVAWVAWMVWAAHQLLHRCPADQGCQPPLLLLLLQLQRLCCLQAVDAGKQATQHTNTNKVQPQDPEQGEY
jgi:hypothetical protein